MKLLLFFIILSLCVLGLCEFLHILKCFLIFPKRKMQATLVVMLNEATAVKQTAFAGEQYKWLGNKLADRVLIVAEGLNESVVKECELLCKKYNLKLVVKGRI